MKDNLVLILVLITAITCWTLVCIGISLDYTHKEAESKRALIYYAIQATSDGRLECEDVVKLIKENL